MATLTRVDGSAADSRVRVARLEKRAGRLDTLFATAWALSRTLQPLGTHLRVPDGCDERRLPRALDRARGPAIACARVDEC